jgi:hypothetical protein
LQSVTLNFTTFLRVPGFFHGNPQEHVMLCGAEGDMRVP